MTINKDDLSQLLDAAYDLKRAVDNFKVIEQQAHAPPVSSWMCVALVVAVLVNFIMLVTVVNLHRDVQAMKETIVIPGKKESK